MTGSSVPDVLWTPGDDARSTTRMGRWLSRLEGELGRSFPDYDALWRWSVDDPATFWSSVWDEFDLRSVTARGTPMSGTPMPGTRWFDGARINYAEHALRLDGRSDDDIVVVGASQTRTDVRSTVAGLRDEVARVRAGLVRLGVSRGDRVVALLPNIPETIVAFLATASLGAIWSSCAPEFGVRSVIDRFAQIEPTVLLTIDGYRYGSKGVDRALAVAQIRANLPTLRATVVLPYLDPDPARIDGAVPWETLRGEPANLAFEPVASDHPLYILYSSGTTGLPKAIVHGHGGILLEHVKALGLHTDLGPTDRFFWFTTTGWMMWNYLVSGLLVGSTVVTFDGDPASPDLATLWRLVAEHGVTYFGASAPFLMACRKAGLEPARTTDLSSLRGIGSTGAPLPGDGFRWVRDAVGRDLPLGSLSGGTDLCTGFLGPSPLVPVWEGEISCRMLGARVESFDEGGQSLVGEQGELVITTPMPSMPVAFWGDPDGRRYREAYFERFPGVWRHGDWLTITERGSCVVSGRSDATLNRGGVRLGTAEFYAVVEALPDVADSLVVHLEDPAGGLGEMLLFVVPATGHSLDDAVRDRIRVALRRDLSPRHVPDRIVEVRAIPRTISGKKLEVPVKRILTGTTPEVAASRDALADPSALDDFVALTTGR